MKIATIADAYTSRYKLKLGESIFINSFGAAAALKLVSFPVDSFCVESVNIGGGEVTGCSVRNHFFSHHELKLVDPALSVNAIITMKTASQPPAFFMYSLYTVDDTSFLDCSSSAEKN